MTEIADTFDSAFTKAVDLGNRLADKDKDADQAGEQGRNRPFVDRALNKALEVIKEELKEPVVRK